MIADLYARVSTDKQTATLQIRELKAYVSRRGWELGEIHTDEGYSGKNTKRPAFNSMMKRAQQHRFDVLVVWKLDRLSRSLKDLVLTLDSLKSWGLDIVSFQDGLVDTTTLQGKLLYQILGVIAEFEGELNRERVKAGKRIGRPSIPLGVIERARELRAQGLSYPKIAKKLEISERSIRSKLKSM